jgi:hypothetical protein
MAGKAASRHQALPDPISRHGRFSRPEPAPSASCAGRLPAVSAIDNVAPVVSRSDFCELDINGRHRLLCRKKSSKILFAEQCDNTLEVSRNALVIE